MSQSAVLGFAVTSLVLIVVPGPSVLFAVSRAIAAGRRNALLTVLGNASGLFAQIAVIALGLGFVITGSGEAQTALRFVGGAYLVWLGIDAIRHRHAAREAVVADAPPVTMTPWRDGFVVGLSNPKTFVVLAALLPRYAEAGVVPLPAQMLLLGAVFCAIAVLSDGSWAVGAAHARRWLASEPRRLTGMSVAGGVVMIGLGLVLAVG